MAPKRASSSGSGCGTPVILVLSASSPRRHTFHPEVGTVRHPQTDAPAPERLYAAALKHKEVRKNDARRY